MWSGLVLDIETGPEQVAPAKVFVIQVPRKSRWDKHRIRAFSALAFSSSNEGTSWQFEMTTLEVAPTKNARCQGGLRCDRCALYALEEVLRKIESGGVIVTFNGSLHDLPFLDRWRADAIKCNDAGRGLLTRHALVHIDMMHLCRKIGSLADKLRGRGWPSLVRACAAAEIPHAPYDQLSNVAAVIRKCETDVMATFLLYLLYQANGDRSSLEFSAGWAALARWSLGEPRAPHRTQFAFCHGARAAAQRSGPSEKMGRSEH